MCVLIFPISICLTLQPHNSPHNLHQNFFHFRTCTLNYRGVRVRVGRSQQLGPAPVSHEAEVAVQEPVIEEEHGVHGFSAFQVRPAHH